MRVYDITNNMKIIIMCILFIIRYGGKFNYTYIINNCFKNIRKAIFLLL